MRTLVFSLALAALTACTASPSATTEALPEAPGAASADIGDWLNSPLRDVRDQALDALRADPGAYLPQTFAWAAIELHQRVETAEAAKWSEFGAQRLAQDIAFIGPSALEHQRAYLAQLPERYVEELGADLLTACRALPAAQIETNREEVRRLLTSTPRRYAPTWPLDPNHAYSVNWVAEPAEWSTEETTRIDALAAQSLPRPAGC